MQSTTTRLSKLTADPTQTKFVVLNPGALPSVTLGTAASRSRRGPLSGPSAHESAKLDAQVELAAASQAEAAMLAEALEECDQDRRRAEHDVRELRELVGDVNDWAGAMLKLRGIGDGTAGEGVDEVSCDAAILPRQGADLFRSIAVLLYPSTSHVPATRPHRVPAAAPAGGD